MKGGLLERLKKTFQEKTEGVYVVTDDGVYLESGTIVIDDDGDSTLEVRRHLRCIWGRRRG